MVVSHACGVKRVFRSPERPAFARGGKSRQKRHLNLRFKNPPALFFLQIFRLIPRDYEVRLLSPRMTNRLSSRAAAAHALNGRTQSAVRRRHQRQRRRSRDDPFNETIREFLCEREGTLTI